MSPGFKSRRWRHMWVEFVVGSLPCHEWFSPGTPVFPSPQKLTFPNSNSTRNQVDKEPLCGCATFKSLSLYLLRGYLIIFVFRMSFQLASTSARFEEYPNKSGIPTFLSSLMSCVITVFSVTGWRKTRFKNGIHSFVSQVISVFYLFYLLFCHTQWITSRIKTIINRLINNKFKNCTLLGRSDCGGEISEKPKVRYLGCILSDP